MPSKARAREDVRRLREGENCEQAISPPLGTALVSRQLLDEYERSPAGLHVPPAERASRAGSAGADRRRAGRVPGAGDATAGVRSSLVPRHVLYPSEAAPLFKLLPDEFAPHWLRAPELSHFLNHVAILCVAEVSAHLVHAAVVAPYIDAMVVGFYLCVVLGKALLALHACLFALELLPLSRYSIFGPQRLAEHSPVLYPLQSRALGLQKRGCLWSLSMVVMIVGVVPYIGFRRSDLPVPKVAAPPAPSAAAPAGDGAGGTGSGAWSRGEDGGGSGDDGGKGMRRFGALDFLTDLWGERGWFVGQHMRQAGAEGLAGEESRDTAREGGVGGGGAAVEMTSDPTHVYDYFLLTVVA